MVINAEFYKNQFKKLIKYIYGMVSVARRFVFNIEKRKMCWYDTPVGLVLTRECWYTEITLFGYKHQIINRYLDYRNIMDII